MNGRPAFLAASSSTERLAAVGRLLRLSEASALETVSLGAMFERPRDRLPTAIFIDATEPEPDPFDACRRLRRGTARARRAIILFGLDSGSESFVKALDAGADDYWPFPFNEAVCRAYLRSVLRRVSAAPAESKAVLAGDIRLDPSRCEALVKGKAVRLRAKEFDVLYHLASRAGAVVSREDLLKAVWGFDDYGNSRAIDFHIGQLRRKLGACADRLETIPGSGYRLHQQGSRKNLT
ncbi:MAG: two-component system, OmpR family, alkaline phosphatase synthesis response regulator PhoP [Elusimicrobia bacterium]|nr:MAG: two-component system, OmpR family, alkaline phosphatase synthesis response regulator PhoP [Elusimicrobiota bacterium]